MIKKITLASLFILGTYTFTTSTLPSDGYKATGISHTFESGTPTVQTEENSHLPALNLSSSKNKKADQAKKSILYTLLATASIALPFGGYYLLTHKKQSFESESASSTQEGQKASKGLSQEIINQHSKSMVDAIQTDDKDRFISLLGEKAFTQNFNELITSVLPGTFTKKEQLWFLETALEGTHIRIKESPKNNISRSFKRHLTMGLSDIVKLTHQFSQLLDPSWRTLVEPNKKLLNLFFNCFNKKHLFTARNKHNESFLFDFFCSFHKPEGIYSIYQNRTRLFNLTTYYILEECHTYIDFAKELSCGLQPNRQNNKFKTTLLHKMVDTLTFVPSHLCKHIQPKHLMSYDDKGYLPLQYINLCNLLLLKDLIEKESPLRFKKGKKILSIIFEENLTEGESPYFSNKLKQDVFNCLEQLAQRDPTLLFERPLSYFRYDQEGHIRNTSWLLNKKSYNIIRDNFNLIDKGPKKWLPIVQGFSRSAIKNRLIEIASLEIIASYSTLLTEEEMYYLGITPPSYVKDYDIQYSPIPKYIIPLKEKEKIYHRDLYLTSTQFKKIKQNGYKVHYRGHRIKSKLDENHHLYMEDLMTGNLPLGPVRILFQGETPTSSVPSKKKVQGLDEEEGVDHLPKQQFFLSDKERKFKTFLRDTIFNEKKGRISPIDIFISKKNTSKIRFVVYTFP